MGCNRRSEVEQLRVTLQITETRQRQQPRYIAAALRIETPSQ
jgi:hypothetical protein